MKSETVKMTIPLCVDLDGTLVRTDMLHESLLLLVKTDVASLARLPLWLAGGRANFKHRIAERVSFDAAGLPYRGEVLDLISEAKAAGRPVVLATASSAKVAKAVASHLGFFDEVLSSDERINLSSAQKAEVLVARYGSGGFDYVGDRRADLPILMNARCAYLVSSNKRLRQSIESMHPDVKHFESQRGSVRAWLKAVRVHQWLKNCLIFVPLLAAHRVTDVELLKRSVIAFVAFSLCASSVYVLNDLLDLPSDRVHRKKKNRPFASGALPIVDGVAAATLLLAAAAGLLLLLPPIFAVVLALYYAATSLYSFWLKRQVVVDVMLLAALYTVRIMAGSAATGIALSFWLLAFSMFIFLCLAMVKRYSELRIAQQNNSTLHGRGYHIEDLPVVLALGTGSGLVAVLVLATYTQASSLPQNYPASEWLWAPPALMLYWVTRLWLKAQRGEVHEDPVVFAATDWQSLVVLALIAISFVLATLGWRFW